MKTLDDLLLEAFEAGANWAFDHNRYDLSPRPDAPDFDTWRANLAGNHE